MIAYNDRGTSLRTTVVGVALILEYVSSVEGSH